MPMRPLLKPAAPVARGWLGLRFLNSDLERRFHEDYCEATRPVVRTGILVISAVYLVFALVDTFWVPQIAHTLLFLRAGVLFPAFAICFVLTYIPALRYQVHWISAGFLAIATGGMVAIFALVPETVDFFGFILAVLVVHSCLRLYFFHASLVTGAMTLGYAACCLLLSSLPWSQFFYQFVYLITANVLGMFSSYSLEYYLRQSFLNRDLLDQEHDRSEQLLLNILPAAIAERLKREPGNVADHYSEVTVLFADLVGFTVLASQLPVEQLVDLLNHIFTRFDELTEHHGVEKIKTIGDAYMVVAGLPVPHPNHSRAIANLALDMVQVMADLREKQGVSLEVRIGMHSGPVIAGVIGTKKFLYDLWGDTVNVASRMESHGIPGFIQVSAEAYALLRDDYDFGDERKVAVKGKGDLSTYLLLGRKHASPKTDLPDKAT